MGHRLTSGVNTRFPMGFLCLDRCPERIFGVMAEALFFPPTQTVYIWMVFDATDESLGSPRYTFSDAVLWVFDFRVGQDADDGHGFERRHAFNVRLTHLDVVYFTYSGMNRAV